jgi:hypothetical protein
VETSTLDAMQDHMESMVHMQSQMASMMQRMQGSLDRLVAEEGMNPAIAANTGNGRTFSTPSTHTNTHLSSIS